MSKTFAEQKEEATAALELMHERIAAGVLSEEDFAKHLRFISRLHNYSPRNVMLMWSQWTDRQLGTGALRAIETMFYGAPITASLPEMTHCAGFSTWSDMGGMVRKGEKALAVLAPFTITDREDIDPATGKPRKKVIGFVLKRRTFDLSQVDGVEAPPSPCKLLEGEGPAGLFAALVKLAESQGFAVNVAPTERAGVNGFCDYSAKEIRVNVGMSDFQQCKTLTHEVAHMLMHGPLQTAFAGRGSIEVEAESVAYVVADMLGFDTSAYSLGYVASWGRR